MARRLFLVPVSLLKTTFISGILACPKLPLVYFYRAVSTVATSAANLLPESKSKRWVSFSTKSPDRAFICTCCQFKQRRTAKRPPEVLSSFGLTRECASYRETLSHFRSKLVVDKAIRADCGQSALNDSERAEDFFPCGGINSLPIATPLWRGESGDGISASGAHRYCQEAWGNS
jgi:hypothetical protein